MSLAGLRKFYIIFLVTALPLQGLYAAAVNIFDDYRVSLNEKSTVIKIEFTKPFVYINHFPKSVGKTCRIKLKPLGTPADKLESQSLSETLSVKNKDQGFLSEINYEQSVDANGILTIQFKRTTRFTVKQSANKRELKITIFKKIKKERKNIKSAPVSRTKGALGRTYVINLKSSTKRINKNSEPKISLFNEYEIYTEKKLLNQKEWHRLRMGFFRSMADVYSILPKVRKVYPKAWVDRIRTSEINHAIAWFNNKKTEEKLKPSVSVARNKKIAQLIEDARQAMVAGEYSKAIRYYARLLRDKDTSAHQEAQELLGLARDRNGQYAHAKAEYEEYLRLYPSGDGATRVKQRLEGLLTASTQPREKLKRSKVRTRSVSWETFGGLSQFYRYQVNSTDATQGIVTDNSVNSDISLSSRRRGTKFNMRIDFSANHRYDFIDDDKKSDGDIFSLYYDLARNDDNYSVRVGRQTHSSDGVLGRFDGVRFGKRIASNKKMNFLFGYPVDFFLTEGVNSERYFYGLSMDIESLAKNLDINFFIVDQTVHGVSDRRAIGAEMRYATDNNSMFALTDYDISYDALNLAIFIANWRFKNSMTLNLVVDYRNSPLLTTNNALIGQTVTNISELRNSFTEDQIRQLSQDRTAVFKSISISASIPLSTAYQISGDITISNLSDTPNSGGVEAGQGTGNEYYYSVQLIANDLFNLKDITIFGLRYSDASTAGTLTGTFSSRFPLSKSWRVNPRLAIGLRDNNDGSKRMTYKPKVIFDYRASRRVKWKYEIGYESSDTDSSLNSTKESSYYVYMGYIYDF